MTRAVAMAVVLGAIACGPSTKATTTPPPEPEPPAATADAGTTAVPAPSEDAAAAPAPDRRARCVQLVDHMIDVAVAEQPKDSQPVAREAMADQRARLIEQCAAGGELTDDEYACAMAANSADAMSKCAAD